MIGHCTTITVVLCAGGLYSLALTACGTKQRYTWSIAQTVSILSRCSGIADIILSNKKAPDIDLPGALSEMDSNRKIVDNNFTNIISHRPVFFSLSKGFDDLVKHIILTTIRKMAKPMTAGKTGEMRINWHT